MSTPTMFPREIREGVTESLSGSRTMVMPTSPIECPTCHVMRAFFIIAKPDPLGEYVLQCVMCDHDGGRQG